MFDVLNEIETQQVKKNYKRAEASVSRKCSRFPSDGLLPLSVTFVKSTCSPLHSSIYPLHTGRYLSVIYYAWIIKGRLNLFQGCQCWRPHTFYLLDGLSFSTAIERRARIEVLVGAQSNNMYAETEKQIIWQTVLFSALTDIVSHSGSFLFSRQAAAYQVRHPQICTHVTTLVRTFCLFCSFIIL